MEQTHQVVFITGCSTGIGRALAREFLARGHKVAATARRVETLAELEDAGAIPFPLDVTDAQSIGAAVNAVLDREGRIDILINNAGFGLMGPLAEIDPDELRRQFETNVIGPMALVRAAAPSMVLNRNGKIVNVGSVSGILPTPYSGAYCASKSALHSLTDVLRLELAPFGIQVISLQPGGIRSDFGNTAAHTLEAGIKPDSLFAPFLPFMRKRARLSQEGCMPVDQFAQKTAALILAPKPPAVIRLGVNSVKLPLLRWLLPAAVIDRILGKKFGLDRLPSP